jgi:hypothetical protein
MGMKCFLLTLGRAQVVPLMLPTLNYTPEEHGDYAGTLWARWVQAKRHALGFSDLCYYFTTLPLMFCHVWSPQSSLDGFDIKPHEISHVKRLRELWYMVLSGLFMLIKLCNAHVILGVSWLYATGTLVLNLLMRAHFGADRFLEYLGSRSNFPTFSMTFLGYICVAMISVNFLTLYDLVQYAVEKTDSDRFRWICRIKPFHYVYTIMMFTFVSIVFFLPMGLAAFRAALTVAYTRTFNYEVASKPTVGLDKMDRKGKERSRP